GVTGTQGLVSPGPVGSPGAVATVEMAPGSVEQVGWVRLGPVGPRGRGGLVETVLSVEPGATGFLHLDCEDLTSGLGCVAVIPGEGPDLTGFRVSVPGALLPLEAADAF
ncbi:PAR10 polymerase, partial [Crocuta crocuta]